MDALEAKETLERLEELVQRLKVDFDRFFNGALTTPPETLRFKVFAEMRRLRSEHHKSAAIRFRVNSLEAKLNSLNELFNRRLREHESGTRRPGARLVVDRMPKATDPYSGVVIGSKPSTREVEALYSELYKKGKRNGKSDLESFRAFLLSQADRIREKTGCAEVVFRVTSNKNGALKLKAKPNRQPTD